MKGLRFLRVLLASLTFVCANLFFLGAAEWAAILFKVQLFPALLALNIAAVAAVLVVTLVFGRVYCSVVCPMGVFQDAVIWLSRRVQRSVPPKKRTLPSPPRFLRYVSLGICAALVALGFVSLGALLDGYSLYGRIAAQVFRPVYSVLHNLIAAFLSDHGHPVLFHEVVFVRGACALAVAVTGLVGVAAMAWWRGRLFCNSLCPVGAVLSLAAHRPLVRIRIDPAKCVKCGLCAASCKCGAIDVTQTRIVDSVCARCFDCAAACRKGAISSLNGSD